ncbi:GIY-YIG nuclease family protein [Microbacterium sp. NPDC077644]|uniref:GIY-YIG nuclease family protein n=1 Tax=Microbacterium sp. NPDC077644 TaxID=3155055 RepID=UPI00344FA04C
MPWMYIVKCADGTYYAGSTAFSDVVARVREHNHLDEKAAKYTRKQRPVRLVYAEEFERVDEAYHREKQVQGWSRRKKEALMAERGEDLPALSRSRQRPARRTLRQAQRPAPRPAIPEPVEG